MRFDMVINRPIMNEQNISPFQDWIFFPLPLLWTGFISSLTMSIKFSNENFRDKPAWISIHAK
jgi:hypothetical protein